MEDQSEPVQVFVRIRPEPDELLGSKPTSASVAPSPSKIVWQQTQHGKSLSSSGPAQNCCVHAPDDKTIRLVAPDGIYSTRKSVSAVDDKVYHFDRIFMENSTQEQIYDSVSEQVLSTVRGYNATIFAYGVTGSGKSFTMTGNQEHPGIIPRAIGDIFHHIEKAAEATDVYFFVRLSYVELYNNTFRNLLESVAREMPTPIRHNSTVNTSGFFTELDDLEAYEVSHGPTFAYARSTSAAMLKEYPGTNARSEKIEVRESNNAGVFLSGPNLRFPVTSATEAYQLISKGNKHRAVSTTNCNEQSSR